MSKTKRMVEVAVALGRTSFYRMPASTNGKYSFTGGLVQYCTKVWHNLEKATEELGLEWQDPASPFVIAMLHKACEIDAYYFNQDYKCWERSESHPEDDRELSLQVADRLGIKLTTEERAWIRDSYDAWQTKVKAIQKKVCCLCGKPLPAGMWGHNPAPLSYEGVCCDDCNYFKVIPARLQFEQEGRGDLTHEE